MERANNHILFIHVGNGISGKLSSIPISEAYMMAFIKKAGFTTSILSDHIDRRLTKNAIERELRENNPLLVGFTCYEVTIDNVRIWARFVKKINPGIKIVIGGPQVQFMPGSALNHMPEVDFLCRGEGEIVLLNLCRALQGNGNLQGVGGICYRNGDAISETCRPVTPETLDEYPSPYLDGTIDATNLKKAILLTSRGCNWDCHFCYTPNATSRRVRYHSVNQVIEELKFLKQKGVNYFWFADPLFSANPSRLKELLNRIILEVPGITFWCECRCEVMNEEIFELMKRAGAVKVAFGLESASPHVLKLMNKRLDLDKLSHAVGLAQTAGIEVELFSIFGLPGERLTDAMETIDYVKRHGIRITGNSGSQKMSIYFGTEFQWNHEKYGIMPTALPKPFYKSIGRDFNTDLLSADDLTRISFAWQLEQMSNASAEDVIFSLNKILAHKNLLSDLPVFHYVLFKVYILLQEYALAFHALKTLISQFPESEYVRRIEQTDTFMFENRTGPAQENDIVVYVIESEDSRDFQILQHRFADLPSSLKQSLTRRPTKRKGEFTMKSSDGKQQKRRFEVFTILSSHKLTALEELDSRSSPIYSGKLLRDEVFEQNNLLFYFALRSMPVEKLTKERDLAILIINFYLNFGLTKKAEDIIKRCPAEFATDLSEICLLNSQPALALGLLEHTSNRSSKARQVRVESLLQLDRLENIETEMKKLKSADQVRVCELWLDVISKKKMPVHTYIRYFDQWMDAKLEQMQ